MKTYIIPYNNFSRSANALKDYGNSREGEDATQVVKIRAASLTISPHNRLVRQTPSIYINWGARDTAAMNNWLRDKANVLKLNFTDTIHHYQNKKEFFLRFGSDIITDLGRVGAVGNVGRTVPYTISRNIARAWINDGNTIVERKKLSSHSGEGIVIHKPDQPAIPFAESSALFTLYVKKAAEYRVHFSKASGIFHIQQKMLRLRNVSPLENPDFRYMIRNLGTGWVYSAHTPMDEVPEDVIRQANLFIGNRDVTLDFGALDIIYNRNARSAYILEVNTSPGLSGTTLEKYHEMILNYSRVHNFNNPTSRYTPL